MVKRRSKSVHGAGILLVIGLAVLAGIGCAQSPEAKKQKAVARGEQYLKNGITTWIHDWKRRNWRTADKKPVKNVDLWKRLAAAMEPHQVEFIWVRGHAGHPENERADALARAQIVANR